MPSYDGDTRQTLDLDLYDLIVARPTASESDQ